MASGYTYMVMESLRFEKEWENLRRREERDDDIHWFGSARQPHEIHGGEAESLRLRTSHVGVAVK